MGVVVKVWMLVAGAVGSGGAAAGAAVCDSGASGALDGDSRLDARARRMWDLRRRRWAGEEGGGRGWWFGLVLIELAAMLLRVVIRRGGVICAWCGCFSV